MHIPPVTFQKIQRPFLPAIQAGYQVAYREAQGFFEDIFEATQTKKRKKLFKLFCGADLLVIDDLFLQKRLPPKICSM
jgi:DNA replication protein DnaC